MSDEQPRYLSYLLRLWQVRGSDHWLWQASLESTSGERQGFPNLDALVAYLEAQTRRGSAPGPSETRDGAAGRQT